MSPARIHWPLTLLAITACWSTSTLARPDAPPPPPGNPMTFTQMDKNSDGAITRDEFDAARPGRDGQFPGNAPDQDMQGDHRPPPPRGQHGPQGPDSSMQNAPHPPRFEDLDRNSDGRVTKEEFDSAREQQRPPEMPRQ